ncbi:hypothetical protein B0H11DRAFT_2254826 [Mycena galericulata]|nr:hypothetical protein B0H11DRAFT_2254826 [Mycena galericulata]
MYDTPFYQFQSSIALATLSLIPNDALRYTLLAIAVCAAILHAIHFKRPSTQIRHLQTNISHAGEAIQCVRMYSARGIQVRVAEQYVQLLRVKRTTSMIQCRLLEENTHTWKKYRLLSGDIAACGQEVKRIRTAVQLMVEDEHQRQYTYDINDAETMLNGFRPPVVQHQASNNGQDFNPASSRLGP